jgi:hypothetical protein
MSAHEKTANLAMTALATIATNLSARTIPSDDFHPCKRIPAPFTAEGHLQGIHCELPIRSPRKFFGRSAIFLTAPVTTGLWHRFGSMPS